nr:HAMP domain-containing sensor histidine kinase [Crossiella equi]
MRPRLVAAFVLVTACGAVAATWASAAAASSALVAETQRRLAEELTSQVAGIAPSLDYPPERADLDRLRGLLGEQVLVSYRDRSAGAAEVPEALRQAVRDRQRLVHQRVPGPRLVLGLPIIHTGLDGTRTPSGVEVYAVRDLAPVRAQLGALTSAAAWTSAIALPVAVLLALLVTRGVLRPVREVRDITRRLSAGDLDARLAVRGRDELAELSGTVNQMADSLRDTVAELRRLESDARRFVADVSHELRTPLTTLSAVSEIMQAAAEGLPADARESADLATAETQRLVRLVEELVEVSRLDAGTAVLRLEEVDVRTAIQDCLRARDWLDRVVVHAPEPVTRRLDRRRLDVIIANLVGNALQHGTPPVELTLHRDRIEVTDHGPGLPEEVLPHVFTRFYKADPARTRADGSGLGLAIALANARLHGGTITAGNAGHGGAHFVLELPGEAG